MKTLKEYIQEKKLENSMIKIQNKWGYIVLWEILQFIK